MEVGARVWCKHAAADKQIMLSLCCHGWQHTQRGAGALPGRRVHPFSQGGGEGVNTREGSLEGGRPGPYRAPITDTSAPPGRNAYSPCGRREGEERRRRKQADIKRGSKMGKKRASEGK